ncbi:hypothetical protein AZE42_07257 [Rhizopogon vesiculosus]|uniref:Uncharacterized protein n=1 Tax=Rhizopogon vesiculosus TaxID=180088 RepID=A0A1J8QE17_9AGAM|nr:hypothetical protein AZE42_07257 [Rhizopogon vesiculosus]
MDKDRHPTSHRLGPTSMSHASGTQGPIEFRVVVETKQIIDTDGLDGQVRYSNIYQTLAYASQTLQASSGRSPYLR